MIVTTKGECQDNMSDAGWQLFCKHQIELGIGNPASWPDNEEITLDKIQVGQYEYQMSSTPNVGKLWHEGKSFNVIKSLSESDLEGVLFNLMEDIAVVKEMLAEARVQSFAAQTIAVALNDRKNNTCKGSQPEAFIDWAIEPSHKVSIPEDTEISVEHHPETEGGRENGGTNAMLVWSYQLPSGNEVKIYFEEHGAFEVEHIPSAYEEHGQNTIGHDEELRVAMSSAFATQQEANIALLHFYQNHSPIKIKDGLVDVWWTQDGKEEASELYIPWEIRMLGSKHVEGFIDDALAQYDEPGYTKTW